MVPLEESEAFAKIIDPGTKDAEPTPLRTRLPEATV
jgi:hypothetical protein